MSGVPEMVAVPSPLSVKLTPGGRPDSPQLGAGYPPALTVKLNAEPSVAVALLPLVNEGARPTMTE